MNYSTLYSHSRALLVGIDNYKHASPLGYAVSDAEALAQLLREDFGFSDSCVVLLTDQDATRQAIVGAFLQYVGEDVGIDDRILFFFAGHGHTVAGHRGEVGYLVPHDGSTTDLSTLVRWDELTRNADLIRAKHIFFVMDACYGGLAITRSLSPGSMRFLRDMLLRYSRQVIAAGKADEIVSDSGGPLPGHSMFTGHLIEALRGKAATQEGVITANSVMAYVYNRVATDGNSRQTPHYGFIDGDGDFIFSAPILNSATTEEKMDKDTLVTVPSTIPTSEITEPADMVERTKQYLPDSRFRIKLHDLVAQELREALLLTSADDFAVQDVPWSLDELTRRLNEYEAIVKNLQVISACLSYWGDRQHYPTLRMVWTRLTDRLQPGTGLKVWSSLRWYPVILLLYTAGISALAAENYEAFADILLSRVASPNLPDSDTELALAVGEGILGLERAEVFKKLPGHERQYVPRSEYLFKLLQPTLDDLLFLGRQYERAFDRFEVTLALVHADLQSDKGRGVWGPIGRFGWKYENDKGANPLSDLIAEAEKEKGSWRPLGAGLFGGDYSRFEQTATKYKDLIARLDWW